MKFTVQHQCLSPSEKKSLLECLPLVEDGRRPQGIRHPLTSILFGIITASLAGSKTLTECLEWMEVRKTWLSKRINLPYGIPDATTVSRALSKLNPVNFYQVINKWWINTFGVSTDTAASLDGKAIRALSGMDLVNHILNLFTHQSHILLGQIGVNEKTNEIPMAPRLINRAEVFEVTITADALLTQVRIAQEIIDGGGNYLLTVKQNRPELWSILESGFDDPYLKQTKATFHERRKTRSITTTIQLSNHFALDDLKFPGLAMVGKLTRTGTRMSKGNLTKINQVSYFITSRDDLTPESAYKLIRGHWSIENNLHWQKDHTFHEDSHRLSRGNAPEIMSCVRSFCISLINQLKLPHISKTIRSFGMQPKLHYQFLKAANII